MDAEAVEEEEDEEAAVSTMLLASAPEDEAVDEELDEAEAVAEAEDDELDDAAEDEPESAAASGRDVAARPSMLTVVGHPEAIVGTTILTVVAVEPPKVNTAVAAPLSSNAGSWLSSKISS